MSRRRDADGLEEEPAVRGVSAAAPPVERASGTRRTTTSKGWRDAVELLTDHRRWAALSRRARWIAANCIGRTRIVDRYERYFLEVLGRGKP